MTVFDERETPQCTFFAGGVGPCSGDWSAYYCSFNHCGPAIVTMNDLLGPGPVLTTIRDFPAVRVDTLRVADSAEPEW